MTPLQWLFIYWFTLGPLAGTLVAHFIHRTQTSSLQGDV